MKTKTNAQRVHPLGERELNFKFLPAGGQFHLRGSDEALTPYGGLVAWDHFLEHCGVISELAANYPLPRTSNNATPVVDVLKAFSLNCLVGGTRFAHGRRLQDDEAVAKIIGMRNGRLCGEDAFRRLCAGLDTTQVETWFAPAEQMIHQAIPPNAVADWDSTVIVRYGKQEDTAIGYNPQKPGRPSHHPLACVIGGTRLCLHMEWRKGNTVSSSGWIEAMEKVWRSPTAQHRIRLNRGDIGFGQESIMAWHEQSSGKRPSYLFKLKLTANVKKAITAIRWDDWQGKSNEGLVQLAEIKLKLTGWSCERRVIVERTLKPLNAGPQGSFWRHCKEDFSAYVTNLTLEEAEAFQVVQLYRQRADAENVFDELKNQWGFSGFCSQKASVSQSSARMLLLIYNLWSLFVRVLKNQGGHTEAIKSRYELLLIPAKMVLSGRRKIVKLAVGNKFASFLKQAYQRLEQWLRQTAPQLNLTMGKFPPWLLFDPTQAPQPAVT
ncbi:MAG: IS1380 family transposase [Akkermansiaceae bacterium]|nr:IS1380 family transposase [Akkermansiaceae bacterium]